MNNLTYNNKSINNNININIINLYTYNINNNILKIYINNMPNLSIINKIKIKKI